MAIPTLSDEQLQAARKAATEARRARADLKTKVRTGEISLGQALDVAEDDEILAHIRVSDLLKALPRVGEKRAAGIMTRLSIASSRRIRGLGKHQLQALKEEFS
ncbi:MAG: 30S ribosomal protein S13 [Actinomycetia bacterium]|nr:30S ribosomal protein S13 [Actinomycetes bacterium]